MLGAPKYTVNRRFPLILDPVVTDSKLTKVLINSSSGLNVLFTKTLKKMGPDVTDMLTKSTSPFYGIVLGNATVPLGSMVSPITFGTRENYRTKYIKFKVADCRMDIQGPLPMWVLEPTTRSAPGTTRLGLHSVRRCGAQGNQRASTRLGN
jgi:hypothetical protein